MAERFELVEALGAGGFGSVWRARDLRDEQRTVALKVLHQGLVSASKMRSRFVREAGILKHIECPHVVKVHEFVATDARMFIVMEYIAGKSLGAYLMDRMRRAAPMSFEETLVVLDQICEALTAAHDLGVVHRDLKPGNIQVASTSPLSVKLLDFGIAKLLSADKSDDTTQGRPIGSLAYMAPEQLSNGAIDRRTDVFALATVCFEMFTLKRAWKVGDETGAKAMLAMIERICRGPRPLAHPIRAEIPARVDTVLARAWSAAPEARYATVREFRDELVSVLGAPRALRAEPAAVAPSDDATSRVPLVDAHAMTKTAQGEPRAPEERVELETTRPADKVEETRVEFSPAEPERRRPTVWIVSGIAIALSVMASLALLALSEQAAPARVIDAPPPPTPPERAVVDPAPPRAETPRAAVKGERPRAPTKVTARATPSRAAKAQPSRSKQRVQMVDGLPIIQDLE